eukprot:GHVN01022183.1.p2 GENE.GHVN01022183.1~~GHVN01022183.1.p2  ORF type:complete len:109 (-),score=8.44 GHVN01022183.1:657-983(-)
MEKGCSLTMLITLFCWGRFGPLSRIAPRHPESNATVESFHRHPHGLACLKSVDFNTALQLILSSYRCTVHSTTQDTPAFLTFGTDPVPPCYSDWRSYRSAGDQDRRRF